MSSGRNLMSLRDMNKTYVVGFPHKDIAHRVASRMSPNMSQLRLQRSMAENIALDVKRSMVEMQMPVAPVADTITIDVTAKLFIPKSS